MSVKARAEFIADQARVIPQSISNARLHDAKQSASKWELTSKLISME